MKGASTTQRCFQARLLEDPRRPRLAFGEDQRPLGAFTRALFSWPFKEASLYHLMVFHWILLIRTGDLCHIFVCPTFRLPGKLPCFSPREVARGKEVRSPEDLEKENRRPGGIFGFAWLAALPKDFFYDGVAALEFGRFLPNGLKRRGFCLNVVFVGLICCVSYVRVVWAMVFWLHSSVCRTVCNTQTIRKAKPYDSKTNNLNPAMHSIDQMGSWKKSAEDSSSRTPASLPLAEARQLLCLAIFEYEVLAMVNMVKCLLFKGKQCHFSKWW